VSGLTLAALAKMDDDRDVKIACSDASFNAFPLSQQKKTGAIYDSYMRYNGAPGTLPFVMQCHDVCMLTSTQL
jgi:hypothetical protein